MLLLTKGASPRCDTTGEHPVPVLNPFVQTQGVARTRGVVQRYLHEPKAMQQQTADAEARCNRDGPPGTKHRPGAIPIKWKPGGGAAQRLRD